MSSELEKKGKQVIPERVLPSQEVDAVARSVPEMLWRIPNPLKDWKNDTLSLAQWHHEDKVS